MLKEVVPPGATDWPTGCVRIVGGTLLTVTVREALLEVIAEQESVTVA